MKVRKAGNNSKCKSTTGLCCGFLSGLLHGRVLRLDEFGVEGLGFGASMAWDWRVDAFGVWDLGIWCLEL